MPSKARNVENWFWACRNDVPAGDAFVIENGQDALWPRVHSEINRDRRCAWEAIHSGHDQAGIEHILDILLRVVPMYQVNHNRFMFEAAKIPAFAKFLRYSCSSDLCNYVSNSVYPDNAVKPEPYSDKSMRKLGQIISATLSIEDDWF